MGKHFTFTGSWPETGILGGPDHNLEVPREFPGATFKGLRTVAGIECEYWVSENGCHHLAPVHWEFVVANAKSWDELVELVTDATARRGLEGV